MKTGICQFSGFKIYPGHGMKYVRIDSKSFTFVDNKCERYFLMKRNPRKIRWTQLYRRLHKKGATEETARKRTRKTQKLQRAIVGASLQEIKQKRNQKPEVRAASREAALKEIKERKKEKKIQLSFSSSSFHVLFGYFWFGNLCFRSCSLCWSCGLLSLLLFQLFFLFPFLDFLECSFS